MCVDNKIVCVTGIGVVTSNGKNKREFLENCLEGVTGIKESTYLKKLGIDSCYAGEIEADDLKKDKFYNTSIAAINEMFADANLSKEDILQMDTRAALSFSSCNYASYDIEEKLQHTTCEDLILETDTECLFRIIDALGVKGQVDFSNAACASGTLALGTAFDLIKNNEADLVIVGGADIFNELSFGGFHILQNMSQEPCRPFDKNRTGISIGEAAAYVMLESAEHAKQRNAHVYAEVVDVQSRNDAYHITSPDPKGISEYDCMQSVLYQFELTDEMVVYVNAHGTATHANDNMEKGVLERLVSKNDTLSKLYVSSSKSMIGHCLGIAGTIEFALCCLCIEEGKMPLSISVQDPEEMEGVVLVTSKEQSKAFDYCISNSFAFAGNCACVGIKKATI